VRGPPPADQEPALGPAAGGDGAVAGLDPGDRPGGFRVGPGVDDPDRRRHLAGDPHVAADVEQEAADRRRQAQRGVGGLADDEPLGDRVEADRSVREPLGGPMLGVEPPGGGGDQGPGPGQLGVGRHPVQPGAPLPEPGEPFDPGLERPAARLSPAVGRPEDLEKLGRDAGRGLGAGLPAGELAAGVVAAEDRRKPVNLAEDSPLGAAGGLVGVGHDPEFQRGPHHVFVVEDEGIRGDGPPAGQGQDQCQGGQGQDWPGRRSAMGHPISSSVWGVVGGSWRHFEGSRPV